MIIADILMIIGSILSFGSLSHTVLFIYIGRLLTGISIGINVTIIVPFLREIQSMLSTSNFKIEKRRFFIDNMFAFGIFLGMIPANIFPELVAYQDVDLAHPETITLHEGDFTILYIITIVPVFLSLLRVVFFRRIGNVKPN